MAGDASAGYVHDALFYGSTKELVAAATSFLRAGLEAGDDVVVVCTEEHNHAISDAMGANADLTYLPRGQIYRRAPFAVPAYRRFLQSRVDAGARRVRLLGEVEFVGAEAPGWREWGRFEAVCNQALAPYPLWSVCAYDTHTLPAMVLTTGELTHPHVRRGSSRTENPLYVEPAVFLDLMADHESERPDLTEPALAITDVHDLYQLRHEIRSLLVSGGTDPAAAENFLLATNEVATNALRHGRGPVLVRLWVTAERFVCTVTDQGEGFDDPFAGYFSLTSDDVPEGQFGLWLARQLCDDFTASHTPEGFTVRLALRHTPH